MTHHSLSALQQQIARSLEQLIGNSHQEPSGKPARRRRPQTAPTVLEQLEVRQMLTDVFWGGGGDGVSFDDPQNWSTTSVPTAADDVIINLANGTAFEIRLDGDREIRSLTIDSADAEVTVSGGVLTVTGQTEVRSGHLQIDDGDLVTGTLINSDRLTISGRSAVTANTFEQRGRFEVGDRGTTIATLTNGFQNFGEMVVQNTAGSGNVTLSVLNGPIVNEETGTIEVTDGGGRRILTTDIDNFGRIELLEQNVEFRKADAVINNHGFFRVGSETIVSTFDNNIRFDQQDGRLIVNGSLLLDNGHYNQTGGAIGVEGLLRVDNNGEMTIAGGQLRNDGEVRLNRGTFQFTGGEVIGLGAIELDGRVDATITHDGLLKLFSAGDTNLFGTLFQGQTLDVGLTDRAEVIAQAGFRNLGTIVVDNQTTSTQSIGAATGLTFENGGTGVIRFTGNGGVETFLTSSFNNAGTIEIITGVSDSPANTFTNTGEIIILEGGSYTRSGSGNGSFVQSAGRLTVNGAMDGSRLNFDYLGGNLFGTIAPRLLLLGEQAGNSGTFQVRLGGEVSGNIQSDQTLLVTNSDVALNGAVVNAGRIIIDSTGSPTDALLDAAGGSLTNTAGGRIITRGDAGELNSLRGNIENLGSLTVESGSLGIDVLINSGTVQIDEPGTLFTAGQNGSFVQQAGRLQVDGRTDFRLSATFSYLGGEILGDVTLRGSDLEINNGVAPARFILTDGGELLTDLPEGVTVTLRNEGTYDAPENFRVDGQLILGDDIVDGETVQVEMSGTLTIGETGLLHSVGLQGSRFVEATLNNQGRLLIDGDLRFGLVDANHVSGGSVHLNDRTLTFVGDSARNLIDGAVTGTGRIVVNPGPFQSSATEFFNAGELAPGQSPGALAIRATTVTLGAASRLTVEIAGEAVGTEHDRLTVEGELTLGGVLDVQVLPELVPVVGDLFGIIRGDVVTGSFSTIENLQGSDFALGANVSPTGVDIEVQEASADLVASIVTAPVAGIVGDLANLTYTVTNAGSDVTGEWIDRIFLGRGDTFDPTRAVLFAEIPQTEGGLNNGESYTRTVQAEIPGAFPGEYRFFVIVDALVQVPDRDLFNQRVASNAFDVTVNELAFGATATETTSSVNREFFKVRLPENQIGNPTEVRFRVLNGSAEIAASTSAVPTALNAQRRETVTEGEEIAFPIDATRPADIFFRIEGIVPGTTFEISFDRSVLAITNLEQEIGSNQGDFTTRIFGDGFTNTTTPSIELPDGSRRFATSVEIIDGETMRATWNLQGLPVGFYNVILEDNGSEAVCEDCLEIVNTAPDRLTTRVTLPSVIRRGVPATGQIDFINEGEADLPAGLFELFVIGGTAKLKNEPNGFFSASHFVMIGGDGTLSSDIGAGSSGTIEFEVIGDVSPGDLKVELREVDLDAAFNQEAFREGLKPEHISDDAWNEAIFPNLLDAIGSTGEDLRAALQMAREHLSQIGVNTNDGDRLLAFLVTHAGEFGEIAQRYEFGGHGFGVSDPTEIKLQILASGSIAFRQLGKVRLFNKLDNGSFEGSPGEFGRLFQEEDGSFRIDEPDQSVWRFDANGKFVSFTSPNGGQMTATHNAADNITSITDEFGETVQYVRGADQLIEEINFPSGIKAVFRYNAARTHLEEFSQIGIDGVSVLFTTEFQFSQNGRSRHAPILITGNTTAIQTTYNQQGKVQKIINEEQVVNYFYLGLATTIQSDDGVEEVAKFGADSNISVFSSEDSSSAPNELTVLLNEAAQVGSIQVGNAVFRQEFSQDFTLETLTNPDGSQITVQSPIIQENLGQVTQQQIIDERGNISTVTLDPNLQKVGNQDATGDQFTSVRDANGNEVARRYADGTQETFQYNENGQVTESVNRDGDRVTYEYTGNGLLAERRYEDGTNEKFLYDDNKRLVSTIDRDGQSTVFTYNDFNQITSFISDGQGTRFEYDENGQIFRIFYPDGSFVQYSYDDQGRVLTVSGTDGDVIVQYEYDEFGRLLAETFSNGQRIEYEYNRQDLMTKMTVRVNGVTEQVTTYRYDESGRPIEQNVDGRIQTFEYNRQGQVTRVTDSVDGVILVQTFDADGSLATVQRNGGPVEEVTTDENNLITQIGETSVTNENGRTTRIDTGTPVQTFAADVSFATVQRHGGPIEELSTDENNFITRMDGTSVANENGGIARVDVDPVTGTIHKYDEFGRLLETKEFTPFGVDVTEYRYNALGQRVAKIVNGVETKFIVNPVTGHVLAETDANGVLILKNIFGNNLVQQSQTGGDDQFFVFDGFGNNTLTSNANGSVTNRTIYDPQRGTISRNSTVSTNIGAGGSQGATEEAGGVIFSSTGQANHHTRLLQTSNQLESDGRQIPFRVGVGGQLVGLGDTTTTITGTAVQLDPNNSSNELSARDRQTADDLGLSLDGLTKDEQQAVIHEAMGTYELAFAQAGLSMQMLIVAGLITKNNDLIRWAASQLDPDAAARMGLDQNGQPIGSSSQTTPHTHGGDTPGASSVSGTRTEQTADAGSTTNSTGNNGTSTNSSPNSNGTDRGGHSNSTTASENNQTRLTAGQQRFQELFQAALRGEAVTEKANAFDPNDIIGPSGVGDGNFLTTAQTLEYTIRFENLETAGLPAQQVVITQTLDDDLDLSTFEFGDFGFGDRVIEVEPGQQSFETIVDLPELELVVAITGELDLATGTITWVLQAQDPGTGSLPANPVAGFLPPNVIPGEGEGFVTYQVLAKADRVTGTRLDAQASIVFDAEDPIETPAIFNTIDAWRPVATMNGLPERTLTETFTIAWSGVDDPGGSGVATFDVFVSTDGGPFEAFLIGTSDTSALFEGEDGKSYAFRVVATDLVGFTEDDPGIAEAFTTVDVNDAPVIAVQDQTRSGDEILDGATTFDRTLTPGSDAEGDFLDIGPGSSDELFELALDVPLVPAGSNTERIVVELDAERIGTRDPLTFAITDGTNIFGVRRLDERFQGGVIQFIQLKANDFDQDLGRNIATDVGFVETIRLELITRGDSTEAIVSFNGITDSFIMPGVLDPTAELSLVLIGQQQSDPIRIRSITTLVEAETGIFRVAENSAAGTVVTTLTASDADDNDTQRWEIAAGNEEGVFAIDADTGAIAVVDSSALDFESGRTFELTVQVIDSLGATDEQLVTIELTDVNESPVVATPLADVVVDEDAPTRVIDLSEVFTDIDGDLLTLSAVSSDEAIVTTGVDGTDLTLSFVPDANGTATITVAATDGEFTVATTFDVLVNAVNDAPIVVNQLPDVTVEEDAAPRTIDLSNVFADVDTEVLTLSAVSGDETLVTVNVDGKELTLDFVPDANGVTTISVFATDGEFTIETSFTVTVDPVNDAPVVANPLPDLTIDEDAAEVVIDLSGVFADIDTETLTLSVNGDDESLIVPVLDGTELTLTPIPNANGTAVITVTATDGEFTIDSTFKVIVTPVNDAPVIVNEIADLTIEEDADPQTIDLSGVFADIDTETLTLTAVGADDSLLTVGLSGTTLTVTPQPNASGTATITVTADDGELTTRTTFLVTITPVNDAPVVLTPLPDVTVAEDADERVIDISEVFGDIDTTLLTFSATSGDGSLVQTTLEGTELSLVFVSDANGSTDITLIASDGEFEAETSFEVTVTPVDDAGTFGGDLTAVTDEDASVTGTVTFSDVADGVTTPNFRIVSGATNGTATITTAGEWEYTPAVDFNGSDEFTVAVTDDGGQVETQVIRIEVAPVNDAPIVVAPLADLTVDEDDPGRQIDLSGVFSDIDTETLVFSVVSSDESIVTASVTGSVLNLAFVPDANGSAELTVTASDGELSVQNSFTITVQPVNDAPTAEDDTANAEAGVPVLIDVLSNDDDLDGDDLTVRIVLGPANGSVQLNADQTVTYTSFATFEGADSFIYEISDGNGGVAQATVNITVTPGEVDAAIRLENGVVIIEGDQSALDDRDRIEVTSTGDGTELLVSLQSGSDVTLTQTFALSDVVSVDITAGDGDDRVLVSSSVTLPVTVDGGAGNDTIYTGSGDDRIVDMWGNNVIVSRGGADHITTGSGRDHIEAGGGDDLIRSGDGRDVVYGGGGNDIIVTGEGIDLLFGGSGRDILIGGDHTDFAFAGSGQDILIGGDTIHDDSDIALNAIRAEWTSNRSIYVRVRNLWNGSGSANRLNGSFFLNNTTILNDHDFDLLFGGRGLDWFPSC